MKVSNTRKKILGMSLNFLQNGHTQKIRSLLEVSTMFLILQKILERIIVGKR